MTRHYTPLGELLRGSFEPLHDAFVAAVTRAVLAPLEQQRHLAPSLATSLPDGTVKTDPSGSAQTRRLRLAGRAHGGSGWLGTPKGRGRATRRPATAAGARASGHQTR